jgi:hypothetical protein
MFLSGVHFLVAQFVRILRNPRLKSTIEKFVLSEVEGSEMSNLCDLCPTSARCLVETGVLPALPAPASLPCVAGFGDLSSEALRAKDGSRVVGRGHALGRRVA